MRPATFVCFACRRVQRQPDGAAPRCPDCGRPCARIGDRVPLPPRDNQRGWDALREVVDADPEQSPDRSG